MTTPNPEDYMSKDTENYSTLRHYTGDLRDINLKGSLDLCGPVCKTGDTDCNANQEQRYRKQAKLFIYTV